MVGINNLGMATRQGWANNLLVLKLIDGSNVGPVNLKHLKKLKGLFGDVQDISKFELMITDGGLGGNLAMSASTALPRQWPDLEKIIGRVMQQAERAPNRYDTLIQFTSAGLNGTLFAGGGVVYAITASPIDSNCGVPDSNYVGPDGLNWTPDAYLPPTLITNVYYKPDDIAEAPAFNLFYTTRRVVVNAFGAVYAYGVLDRIGHRTENQSIIRALRGGNFDQYVRGRSNKSWKIVKRTGGVARLVEADLNANLEKVRIRLDKTEMQRYHVPAKASADERFTVLKTIAVGLDNVLIGNDFAPGFPTTFIERLNALTTSLRGENPAAYSVLVWEKNLESYIQKFSDFAGIITGYATGWFMKLNAAERAGREFLTGGTGGELTVTGAGTGTGNETVNTVTPVPTPVPTPTDLQAGADVLSQVAFVNGQLDWAKSREISPVRNLRFAYVTRGVKFNGIKHFLTMVKLKESSKKSVYVAQFVYPIWDTACDPAYQ